MFLPIISKTLVEFSVLFRTYIVRGSCPNGLCLVELLVFNIFFFNFLLFLRITTIILIRISVLSNILDFWLPIVLFLFFLVVRFIISDFLFPLLLNKQLNR